MEYTIRIVARDYKEVTVEANSSDEALDKTKEMFGMGEIDLDFLDVKFEEI